MSLAPELRFVAPAADAFIVDPDTVPEQRLGFLPRYGDERWSLLALTQNPSATDDLIRWAWFPEIFREAFRYATWSLINYPLPDPEMLRHGSAMRSKLSSGRVLKTVNQWSIFAQWLTERGIGTLSRVAAEDLAEFAAHLDKVRGLSRNTATSHLIGLSRLHYYGRFHLPPQDRLVEPPWLSEGLDDYLPAASALGENITEPIAPATMGPLLVWALRFVEEFADDIMTANEEHARLSTTAEALRGYRHPASADGLLAFLDGLKAEGKPVPTATVKGRKLAVPGIFLAGKTGTPAERVHQIMGKPAWRAYIAANPGPCLLEAPVTATLGGEPWHEPFEFYTFTALVRHLVTACYIVLGYLTGMRTGEKGAELRLMQHPAGRAKRIAAGRRGRLRGRPAECD
ncbi:hypothetical protein AB0A71_35265 [Kitasatospora aureofaciens]|uniref:hypothetical protein n=1 Tax=Kitasatospora aureofaciens TaxID=1894 RepID=UPI0033DFE178